MSDRGSPVWLRRAMELDYFRVMPALARVSWPAALWWGRRRGDLRFWWRTVGREATIANLERAYDGRLTAAEARRIARECFRAQTCEEVETFFFPGLTRDAFGRYIAVEGLRHLDAALADRRGAVIFSSHYGSMCLAMIALAHLGYGVNVLARSIDPADNPLDDVVRRYAERKVAALEAIMGRPFIVAGKPGAMQRVREALAAGELLYILVSVPPELARHCSRVRFLGHPAELPLGVEYIASQSGAPLVPFTIRRNGRGFRHTLSFDAPVPGPEAGPGTLQRCVDVVEREIRRDPSQFFMWEFLRSFWVDETATSIDAALDTGYEATAHGS